MPPGILLLAKLVEARRLICIDHPPGQHRALLHIHEHCSACCYVIRHRRVCMVALGRYQFRPELIPAERDHADTPVPYYIATGRAVLMDVKKGTVLTWGMVDTDQASRLYQLRQQQNAWWHQ